MRYRDLLMVWSLLLATATGSEPIDPPWPPPHVQDVPPAIVAWRVSKCPGGQTPTAPAGAGAVENRTGTPRQDISQE